MNCYFVIEMNKFFIIGTVLLILLMMSCGNPASVSTSVVKKYKADSNFVSSVIFLHGSELKFKLYSRGCVQEETQRIEISKVNESQFVISYFKDEIKLMDKKVVDSSFEMYIKSFIYECDKLLKDSLPASIGFVTIETIQISDGLHIINVSTDQSKSRNPFNDLVYAIHSKSESK